MIGAEVENIRKEIQEDDEKIKDQITQYVKLHFKIGKQRISAVTQCNKHGDKLYQQQHNLVTSRTNSVVRHISSFPFFESPAFLAKGFGLLTALFIFFTGVALFDTLGVRGLGALIIDRINQASPSNLPCIYRNPSC